MPTLGHQHRSMSRAWFHTEPPGLGHGHRVFARVLSLRLQVEWEFYRRPEWEVALGVEYGWRNVLSVRVGPGVIPF